MKTPFRVVLLFLLTACAGTPEEMVESETLFSLIPPDFSGVEFKNEITESRSSNHLVNDMLISGGGIGVGDINNDGLPDLYFTGNQVRDELYINKGNFKFERITDDAGIIEDHVWSSGVTFVDINKDGWQDIYVCKYTYGNENLGANLLYINNQDNTFSEKAIDYGLSDRGFSVQATFFDFDLDGFLDLYLVNQPPSTGNRRGNKITLTRLKSLKYSDKIFKNMGNGKFYDVSEYCGVRNLSFGLSATVTDYNNDGWPDIYVANDYEKPDQLYINQRNGKFVNTINSSMGHISNFSMGVDAADYDNDGSMDLMVVDMVPEDHKRLKTNMGGMDPSQFWEIVNKGWHHQYMFNTLQRNNGDATFAELGQLAGISSTDWSWTPLFGDFDLDGNKDLFISNGSRRAMRNSDLDDKYDLLLDSLDRLSAQTGKKVDELIDLMEFVELSPVEKMPNYIFKNNGDLTFSKKVEEWGFSDADLAYGAAYADLDNDGDLDLVLNNTDEISRIYRNYAVEKGLGNYLKFVVLGKDGSPAYGSRVNLYKDGKFWQMAEMTNVRGYKSKSQDLLHFGVGSLNSVEKVEVIWPNGYRKYQSPDP
ncbi:MAG: CRTAC1 family protein [Bacteroidota bacterium]